MSEATLPKYGIRACRGHWHVIVQWVVTDAQPGQAGWCDIEDGAKPGDYRCEDLAIEGDPFKTEAAAQEMADRMNGGYEPRSQLSMLMSGELQLFTPKVTAPPPPRRSLWDQIIDVIRRRRPAAGGGR